MKLKNPIALSTLAVAILRAQGQNIYVGVNSGDTGSIIEIAPGGAQTTVASGLPAITGLAIDSTGDLFLASPVTDSIIEIAPEGAQSTVQPWIADVGALAIDSTGDLVWSSSFAGFIEVGGAWRISFEPGAPPIGALTFDSMGDLLVAQNNGAITEFTPGGAQSTVASGLPAISGLAFDSTGDLFEADYSGNITEIAPGGAQTTIATGLPDIQGLAIESTPPTPSLAITSQPQPVTVNADASASFSVTANGTPPLSYQWSFNGTNISGANASSLTIFNVTPPALGAYAVVVSNVSGTITSSIAMLSMYPFLAVPFNGDIVDWGKNATLSVQAWGTGPLTYQWYDNGLAIANATNQTLSLADIRFASAGLYSVVVSSPFGSVTNTPAQVVVNVAGVSLGFSPTLTIVGMPGFSYIIQSTTNLANTNSWITLTNLTLTQPTQLFIDTTVDASSPFNSQHFYKVLAGQ